MILENKNPYNQKEWEIKFKDTELYKKLQEDFDIIAFDHFVEQAHIKKFYNSQGTGTPRQNIGSSIFSGTIFYYIDYLLQDNPEIIYDIGCGWNIFKKYMPIYGYDPYSTYADSRTIPSDFHGKYVMSVNALHFSSIDNLTDIVTDFYNKIDEGGKGFLTLNTARMTKRFDLDNVESDIRTQLFKFYDNLLVFDLDLSFRDAYLDGNVRMVFSK